MEKNLKITHACDANCPVKKALNILSGKWTMMILYQINTRTIRYGELKRAVAGISENADTGIKFSGCAQIGK